MFDYAKILGIVILLILFITQIATADFQVKTMPVHDYPAVVISGNGKITQTKLNSILMNKFTVTDVKDDKMEYSSIKVNQKNKAVKGQKNVELTNLKKEILNKQTKTKKVK